MKNKSFSFINVPASRATHLGFILAEAAASVTVFTWAPWAKVLTLPASEGRAQASTLPSRVSTAGRSCWELMEAPFPARSNSRIWQPRRLKAGVHTWRGPRYPFPSILNPDDARCTDASRLSPPRGAWVRIHFPPGTQGCLGLPAGLLQTLGTHWRESVHCVLRQLVKTLRPWVDPAVLSAALRTWLSAGVHFGR